MHVRAVSRGDRYITMTRPWAAGGGISPRPLPVPILSSCPCASVPLRAISFAMNVSIEFCLQ